MWIHAESDDVLSQVLSTLALEAFASGAFEAGGDWAIEFPAGDALVFKLVSKGECWLFVQGEQTVAGRHLRAGDCFLVAPRRSFVLSGSPLRRDGVRLPDLLAGRRDDGTVVCNGGGEVASIGTAFRFDGHFSAIVFDALPPVIPIPAESEPAAVLRWSLERLAAEFAERGEGHTLMMRHLAPILLLQTLRRYLAAHEPDRNWLVALAHPKLSKAIRAMHADCARAWTLDALAGLAGMSRAGFAQQFRQRVGLPPIDYLAHWRMQLACHLLRHGSRSIAQIAAAVGYESESGFSAAFVKIVQCRPGSYRLGQRGAAPNAGPVASRPDRAATCSVA